MTWETAAPYIFSIAGSVWLFYLLYCLLTSIRGPKKAEPQPVRKKSFLDEALEADEERRASVPHYAWNDLQRDLHDGKVTFDEIWERCGGRLPRKPEVARGSDGQNGGSGIVGASGVSGTPNDGPPDEEPLQGVNLKRLIGECPSKWKEIEPELPIWVKCCACSETREYGYPRVCGMCGGKGYLIGRET
jgi:hypothetical protein